MSVVNRWVAPVAFLAVMFGGVGVAQATGQWITSGRLQPATDTSAAPTVTGQQTLRQVASTNQVDLAALVAALGLPSDVDVDQPLKELHSEPPGFEMQDVRDAVTALR